MSTSNNAVQILVLDDDAEIRECFSVALAQIGCAVVEAGSVQEAFRILTAWKPDIIVSDINMPSETGFDFIRKFRERNTIVPVIAVSGCDKPDHYFFAAGFNAFVTKPVGPDALVKLVVATLKASGNCNATR